MQKIQKILGFQNAKTIKGEARNIKTGIIYFAPNTVASDVNMCPSATVACIKACLYTAGRGGFNTVQTARIEKTKTYLADKPAFIARLEKEIENAVKLSKKKNFQLAIRLNGTSDLAVEAWGVIEKFPDVNFYDYTKVAGRMTKFLAGGMPKNYHLTFSLSENNKEQAQAFLAQGGNVAVVFRTNNPDNFPKAYWGFPVISGDADDIRFMDPKGVIVALKQKGRASKDSLGFVQPIEETKTRLAA